MKVLRYLTVVLGAFGKRYCGSTAEDAAFFKPTPENWRESRAGEKYAAFAVSMIASPEWAGRESEPSLFALQKLGWEGFECGVSYHGCTLRPSCDDVLTELEDTYEARWVWFVFQAMHHLTLISSVIDAQTVDSQVNLVALAESAAHNFYWKYDESVANKCKILAGLKKAAIQAAFVFLAILVPATAPAAGVIPAIEAGSSSFLAMNGPKLTQFALNFASAFPTNVAGSTIDQAACPFANADKGLEKEASLKIQRDIGHFYDIYREVVESTNSDIIKGPPAVMFDVFLSGNPTRLAQVIRSGEYLDFTEEQDKRFVREPNLIEQDLTQYYKNALISTILKGQMCYIECSSKRSSQSDITRFEPEEGKFCAAKCWQNWASEKTLKVYGLDEIAKPDNDWGIQVRAFLEASYDHYKTNGFQNGQMLPSAEDLFDDEVETTSGSYLPVCDSHITHKESKVSGIPCMCGNEYGSDTAKFWEEANFASWKAVQINGDLETKKGPPYLCKNDMAYERTPPVAYFLNMCNMDWRWPTKKDDAHLDDNLYLHKGADPLCGLFKEEVDKFKQDQAAGALEPGVMPNLDCYMCYQSTAGGRVQHGDMCQKDNILNLFRHKGDPRSHKFQDYNFKRACELMEEESEMCGVGSS